MHVMYSVYIGCILRWSLGKLSGMYGDVITLSELCCIVINTSTPSMMMVHIGTKTMTTYIANYKQYTG